MSLALDIIDYIEDNVESLTVDTNLFHGGFPDDAPDLCVTVDVIPGGTENRSGMKTIPFQVIARDEDYEGSNTLINSVYDIFANKPGFDGLGSESVKYCQPIQTPYFSMKDDRNRYLFIATFLLRKDG